MAFSWWCTYVCAPSSETRGRRAAHNRGCGYTLHKASHDPIEGDYRPQGSPCPNCGKRTRLNEGLVREWFCLEDAILYATEQNERNGFAVQRSLGEYSREQNGEQLGEEE